MAYGKGKNKDLIKRMVDLGRLEMTTDLGDLRSRMLTVTDKMADAIWPGDVFDPVPSGKELDAILLRVQSQASKDGLNSVWGEKARFIAKAAVQEQWKRAQRSTFGKLRNIAAVGDTPLNNGTRRLLNLPEELSRNLTDEDVAQLQDFAHSLGFTETVEFFRTIAADGHGLPAHQADALRAMADLARARWKRPVWKDDAVIQLHLDFRCVRGGRVVLAQRLASLATAMRGSGEALVTLPMTSVSPRGKGIAVHLRKPPFIADRLGDADDVSVGSLALELGPLSSATKIVLTKPASAPLVVGARTVVAEDFGFANTSSIVVLRSGTPISEAATDRISGHNGGDGEKLTKRKAKDFLERHSSGGDIEVLETVQFDGRDFLGRIKAQSSRIDRLRSEIDRMYKRLARIREEINVVAGLAVDALVPEEAALARHARYVAMHVRFFRLLAAVKQLKGKRRGIYRAIAGLKASWFGHVARRKAALAEKHGAVVVTEDLDILAIPKDDDAYKGRTFNKMNNNGAKGQYILRSGNILKWRGIASIKVPSFYTSSTDWRTGTVDKKQRRGRVFSAAIDGRVWDADLHAAEMIGRYLFLKPKTECEPLALAA